MKNYIYLMTLCLGIFLSACSNIPATEFVSETPFLTGHVVEINNEKQVFAIIEDISKQEALDHQTKEDSSNEVWIYINKAKIDGKFKIGDKVAIWKNSDGPEKTGVIAKRIVVLEE
ncbi:hypothetical protein [Paenisporosarcina sp. NPDC076898]|uniref:hypothetical protein n=1 Tax=unclassified Paenisporosarcina TaxID=2642018 RepID=UPI003D02E53B